MTRTSNFTRSLLLLAVVLALAVACRRDDQAIPTPAATAESATAAAPTDAPAEDLSPTEAPVEEPTTAPAAAALDPADFDWPPQVIDSSVGSGAQAPINEPVMVRFDQPMDQDSVESALSIEPAVDSEVSWPAPDTLMVSPAATYEPDTGYTLRIADTASAISGLTLEQPVEIDWQTVGALEATQFSPEGNSRGVPLDAVISVAFNQPVVPLVSTGDQAGLPQPLIIEPAVNGRGEWVSTSIYRFIPDPALAGATSYSVSVDPALQAIGGATIVNPPSWSFTTLSPEVVSIAPDDEATNILPTAGITITFSAPMDRATTEAAVSLTGAGAVPVTFEWSENDTVLALQPEATLALETLHTVTVSTAATAAVSGSPIDREASSTFTTVPFPAVESVQPADGTVADIWQRGFSVNFVSPMDPETIEDRIVIEPAPANPRYFYNEWEGKSSVFVDFALIPDTSYTITIPADAADPYGNTFGEPYTWTFLTPPYPAIASFNLPREVAQVSTTFATTVEVIHRNVSEFTVDLYDQPLDTDLLFNIYEISQTPPVGEPIRSFTLNPSASQNEAGVAPIDLADGGTLPAGLYRLRITSPDIDAEDAQFWQNQNVILIVGDTNLVVKEMFGEVHVWATDLETGQPAPGRNIVLYTRSGAASEPVVTDDNGFASFDYQPSEPYLEGVIVASNEPGQAGFGLSSSFWTGGFSPWNLGVNYNSSPEDPIFVYIYTDRPIYRPGDTVYYKGIVRSTNFGRYALPDLEEITIAFSPTFFTGEGEQVEPDQFTLALDENGSFNGEYLLAEDLALGDYQITLPDTNYWASLRTFTVAEYRRPEFSATLTPEVDEALRGEAIDVLLEADYLFGAPASNVAVTWNIYQTLHQPTIETQPPYAFGDTAGFYQNEIDPFFGIGVPQQGEYLVGGEGVTDEQGNLVITLPADLLDEIDPGSRNVRVEATLGANSEFPISTSTSVVYHDAEVYVGLRTPEYVSDAGVETTVELLTVDWAGEAVGNLPVEVVFYLREWESERSSDYGMYMTSWTAVDTEVARESVTTDADGQAAVSFTPEVGGSYLAVATVKDAAGREQLSSLSLWVLDPGYSGWRSDPKERTMLLVRDKDEYQIGETARILVQTPFADPVQAWLTIERGNLIEQRVITVAPGQTLDIPITAEYAPNVHVMVTAVKPANPGATEAQYADIRLGVVELLVDTSQLELNVALAAAQDTYKPGDTASFTVTLTDSAGNPATADVSLALVDLAVLLLKEDNAPHIVEAFYAPQPLRSQTGSGLFISGEGLEAEVPLQGGGFGGGGGDVAAAESARVEDEDESVRDDFKDTAYWEATLPVSGSATVEIPLPDNLTTWRLSSKASNQDTIVGQNFVEIQVQLPLQVRPVTPRFFTVGDALRLGTNVDNNTDQDIEATVSLEALGLAINGEAEQVVTVPANGRVFVSWDTVVQDVQFADLTFRVEGGGYTDASKPTIGTTQDGLMPVYRFNGRDFVATAGELEEPGRRVEAVILPQGVDPSQGEVDIVLQPSLAAAIIDSFDALVEPESYLSDCASTYADRLIQNTATQKAVEDLGVREDLLEALNGQITTDTSRLKALVHSDGGWGWCFDQESDEWITAYSLLALVRARDLGYEVDEALIDNAATFVRSRLERVEQVTNAEEANRNAFFLYVLAESGDDVVADADALIAEHRALLDPYAKALLALAYQANGASGDSQAAMVSDLSNSAILSATGAHWEDAQQDFMNLSSDIRGTAMVVDALSQIAPESDLLPPAVRWLMVARQAQNWPTTHESAWSIQALSDYMAASGELEANYDYRLNVNTRPETEGAFDADTLTESEAVSVPLGNLLVDGTNYFDFQRGEGDGKLYYTMVLDSAIAVDQIDPVSRGMTVTRQYFAADCDPQTETCEPLTEIDAGERVRAQVTVVLPEDRVFVVLEDPIPAGMEAIDPSLLTSPSGTGGSIVPEQGQNEFGWWGWWYFDHIQYGDEKVTFLSQFLPAGTYQYSYYLDPVIPGTFQVMPATAREQFFPEVFGRSEGSTFTIRAAE
jgi:hypothetical protein